MQFFLSRLLSRSALSRFFPTLLLCTGFAFADPIDVTTSQVSQFTLSPSADALSFNGGSTIFDPNSGASFVFKTGTFTIGDSGTLVQDVPFSFQEQIQVGDVTRLVTITGDDDITWDWDTLNINGTGPIDFGGYTLVLQPFTIADNNVGDVDPISLDATVTPEPGSLLLLGTGMAGFGGMMVRRVRAGRNGAGEPLG